MEERRRETGSHATAGDSPAPRRRGGGMKRKASGSIGSLTSSASSSSKRAAREKAGVPPLPPHPIHDGPLTRARQFADAAAATSFEAKILQAELDSAAEAEAARDELEELSASRKHSEALEASIEAEVEVIRSRGAKAHVIPVPAGWFSWVKVHPIEKHSLPSFFSGESENRSPEIYLDIRNWIVNKFHTNPGVNIESKDLADLSTGKLDCRLEVMEFLESWGLINYNPFPLQSVADNREIEDDKGEKRLVDVNSDSDIGDRKEVGIDMVSDKGEKSVLNTGSDGNNGDERGSIVIVGGQKDAKMLDGGTDDKKVEADAITNIDKNAKREPGVGSDAVKVERKESGVDATADKDEKIKAKALIEKLYRFETEESHQKTLPKSNLATPVAVGLFHESAIAEELVKQEGPAYHCNSCSADCSRKRYHCQKQADFDLCSECYTNGKFGSGMSPSDFILMEPGDVSGATGGKWTDQETLLLLEALELYKENWNEIAEHVATKTKAQCILHFLQMPIEDSFLNSDDDAKETIQEIVDPSATRSDHVEDSNAAKGNPVEDPNTAKCNPVEDPNTAKSDPVEDPDTAKSNTVEDPDAIKSDPVEDSNTAKPEPAESPNTIKTEPAAHPSLMNTDLSEPKEAPEALKDQAGPADAQLAPSPMVAPELDGTQDMEVTKEIDGDLAVRALKEAFEATGSLLTPEDKISFADAANPVMTLAAFLTRLVEPDMSTASARCSLKSMGNPSAGLQLSIMHSLLLDDQPDVPQDPRGSDSAIAKKVEQDDEQEEKEDNERQKDVIHDGNHTTNQNERSGSTCSANDFSNEQADVQMKDSGTEANPSDLSDKQDEAVVKMQGDDHPVETAADDLPDNQLEDVAKEHSLDTDSKLKEASTAEDSHSKEAPQDVNMESEPIVAEEQQNPDHSDSLVEDEAKTGHENERDTKTGDQKSEETKDERNMVKLKQAAMTTLAAAAVKAKLLVNQEEDDIRQLAALLIEKQLRKLELKLGYFADMESIVTRIREHMDRSRQKLYHERAQIIAARLGLPSAASRVVPSMLPAGRGGAVMGQGNPLMRPPMGMQRPPLTTRPVMISVPATSAPSVPPTGVEGGGTLPQPSK